MAYEYTRENDLREGVCFLCKKEKVVDEDGIIQDTKLIKREVFCKIGGIYEKEFYDAHQSGIKAQYKVVVFAGDYDKEMIVDLEGVIYSVYRRYQSDDNFELYLREDEGTWD